MSTARRPTRESPGQDGFTITPSNTVDFTTLAKSIWVGVAGNVTLVTSRGTTLTFVGCQAGSIIPVEARRVDVTGTTATSLVAITQ